jgi:signal transduction histidine kinase
MQLPLHFVIYRIGRPPEAVSLQVKRAQLELLLQKTGAVRTLAALPFVTPLALIFYIKWNARLGLVWLALFYIVALICYVRRKRLDRHGSIADHELDEVFRGRIHSIVMLGAMWGLGPWLLGVHGNFWHVVLVSSFTVGAVSLTSSVVSTHRETIVAFNLPTGIGIVTASLWHGGSLGWVMAISNFMFVIMTLKWSYQQTDQLIASLKIRFEKEDLAHQLEKQVELVEDANREKSRFLASASHDLRQPLHAISLFTSVLERSSLDPQSRQTVSQLGHSIHMLSHSLDTMLDVSRLDAGAVQPRFEVLRVHDLFVSLHNNFSGRAQERGLQLRFRAPGELAVQSDAQLLERLLGNLIDNALKYTKNGGVLVAARAGLAASKEGQIRFDIIDTGIGIPKEYHQLIFDEFFQIGNPQRDRRFGLGIGLSIVRRLSELLEHPIELHSQFGRGTCFKIWAPKGEASMVNAAAYRPANHQDTDIEDRLPRSILVVDDEVDSRHALATLLASYGCKVCAAGDVDQAERLLMQHPVDAVVADFRLPGERNGLDFLIQLRTYSPHIRTLLVTGETAPHRITTIKASGMPCLYKPVMAQELLKALAD